MRDCNKNYINYEDSKRNDNISDHCYDHGNDYGSKDHYVSKHEMVMVAIIVILRRIRISIQV